MSKDFPLSILDLAPIVEGVSTTKGLNETVALAQAGERLGYERIWFAEHHGMPVIGSVSPEILIANTAAQTKTIKVGSGGIMLLNHMPLRIVEAFRMLEALNPGRIDLGLGRAPGGDGYAMRALRTGGGEEFAEYLAELLAFEHDTFPQGHPFAHVQVAPGGVNLPPMWMLGSSGGSAHAAGELGMGYAFAAHFSPTPGRPAIDAYKSAFTPSEHFPKPRTIICVSALCAETDEEAEFLSGSQALGWALVRTGQNRRIVSPEEAANHTYTPAQLSVVESMKPLWIVGGPQKVRDAIEQKRMETGADEVMITTTTHDYAKRIRSYELIAKAFS